MEVGLHELFVEIHLIKVPIWAKDNVHVIQASDLRVAQKENNNNQELAIYQPRQKNLRSCVCGNGATTLIIIRGGRATQQISKQKYIHQSCGCGEGKQEGEERKEKSEIDKVPT